MSNHKGITMKSIILLLTILLTSCGLKHDKQFYHSQKIKIVSGFYKGYEGYIIGQLSAGNIFFQGRYQVLIVDLLCNRFINSEHLEPIKPKQD